LYFHKHLEPDVKWETSVPIDSRSIFWMSTIPKTPSLLCDRIVWDIASHVIYEITIVHHPSSPLFFKQRTRPTHRILTPSLKVSEPTSFSNGCF
jgi:hypothetical protein